MVQFLRCTVLQCRIVRFKAVHERLESCRLVLMRFQIFVSDLKVTDVIACQEIIVMEAFIKGFRYGKIFVSLTCNQRGFILVCADIDQHRIAALQAVINAVRRFPINILEVVLVRRYIVRRDPVPAFFCKHILHAAVRFCHCSRLSRRLSGCFFCRPRCLTDKKRDALRAALCAAIGSVSIL